MVLVILNNAYSHNFSMKERYALSKTEKQYLRGQITLSNPATYRSRIRKKAEQSVEIAVPILTSQTISQDFKDACYPDNKIEDILKHLVRYDFGQLPAQQINKQAIARHMVEYGMTYFQSRYKQNQLINDEIEKIKQILASFDYQARADVEKAELIKMYETRKRSSAPPFIQRDEFYHARCVHCYNYSLGTSKTKEEAIKILTHNPHCTYLKYIKRIHDVNSVNDQFIQIFAPIKKKR